MRIGVFTAPVEVNCGTVLQAYALRKIFEKLNNDVTIIYPNLEWLKRQHEHFNYINKDFIDNYVRPLRIENYDDLKEDMFDFLIVGAERVWMKGYLLMDITQGYFNFAKDWNTPRISYACSFGTNIWNYNIKDTEICKELIKKFKAVSVREKCGIDLCKNILNVDSLHVLDPAFLLSKEEWLSIIDYNNVDKHNDEEFLFAYVFNKNKNNIDKINKIAEDNNIKKENIIISSYGLNVNQWLFNILNAKIVVTDSYHGSVFRTIFGGKMIVFKNDLNGIGRFDTIGDTLAATDNVLSTLEEYDENKSYEINNITYEKINEMKKISMNYIYNNIKGE